MKVKKKKEWNNIFEQPCHKGHQKNGVVGGRQ